MNWLQKISAYQDTFELRHDGKLYLRGSEREVLDKLHDLQGGSAQHALQYEGWTITPSGTDWRDAYQWYGGEENNPQAKEKVKLDNILLFCGYCGNKTMMDRESLERDGFPRCIKCNRLTMDDAYAFKCDSCGEIKQIAAFDLPDGDLQCEKCGGKLEDVS